MPRRAPPALGPRGEGWFVIQVVLLAAVALAGVLGPNWSGLARALSAIAGSVMMGGGLVLAVRGVHDLRSNLTVFPRPLAGAQLVDTGVFRLVRHPIYGGLIIGAFGWGLVTASAPALGAAVVLALFFRFKAAREEVWLREQFDAYDDYRARTRRFIPGLY